MKKYYSRNDICKILIQVIGDFANENEIQIDLGLQEETRLYGGDSVFDSMALVSLIVYVEEILEEKTGESLILADEKAMSRRTSPFLKVGLLADYIFELLTVTKD